MPDFIFQREWLAPATFTRRSEDRVQSFTLSHFLPLPIRVAASSIDRLVAKSVAASAHQSLAKGEKMPRKSPRARSVEDGLVSSRVGRKSKVKSKCAKKE